MPKLDLERIAADAEVARNERAVRASSMTVEQKYAWLCERLEITNADYWENDALISLTNKLYFQFSNDNFPKSVDEAIVAAIESDLWLQEAKKQRAELVQQFEERWNNELPKKTNR